MSQLIISAFYAGLIIHLLAGHSVKHIANDFTIGAAILIVGLIVIVCLRMTQQILKVPIEIWNKNRRATFLIKKVNSLKELSEKEQLEINRLIDEKILIPVPYIYEKQWRMYLRLSNTAINNVLYY